MIRQLMVIAEDGAAQGSDASSSVLAVLALVISIAGIILQVLSRHWDGGRISVRMRPVLIPVRRNRGFITQTVGSWPMDAQAASSMAGTPDLLNEYVEAAEVIIENRGRTPATVFDVTLVWRENWASFFPVRDEALVLPLSFAYEQQGSRVYVKDVNGTRLEPNDQVTVLLDYWSILEPGRVSNGGRRALRASARVAGRVQSVRSSRRRAWIIPDWALTGVGRPTLLSLRAALNRAVLRANKINGVEISHVQYLVHRLARALTEAPWPSRGGEQFAHIERAVDRSGWRSEAGAATPEEAAENEFARLELTHALADELTAYSEHIDWPPPRG